MTDPIIPLYSTSASLKQGSVFTVEKAGAAAKSGHIRGPISLCDLAAAEKLTRMHIVASNFVDFFMAYKNLKEVGCDLAFGLKVVVCEDLADKSEASFKSESKVVLFMRNDAAYKPLIKLYTKASTDGFYYVPRLDWRTLRAMWSDDLILALPFYSSFLARNTLTFSAIVPDLPATPVVMREVGQELPIDSLLDEATSRYTAANSLDVQPVKSIYYAKREDSRRFQVWRAILHRTAYDKPNMDWMCSREFCHEAWKELVAS